MSNGTNAALGHTLYIVDVDEVVYYSASWLVEPRACAMDSSTLSHDHD
jgi:hypothetical protein